MRKHKQGRGVKVDLKNKTKNQHFLSQSEQRLNASNPIPSDHKNARIFEFNVIDRENFKIEPCSKKGRPIRKSLSFIDLFSFDIPSNGDDRYNFEDLFKTYEHKVRDITLNLLSKLKTPGTDVASEIQSIFAIKYMNLVRNPYSAKEVLNTLPHLRNLKPTDNSHLANFERVLNGSKPQQKYLCELLNISKEDYTDWLGIIFIALAPLAKNESNFINTMTEHLLSNKNYYVAVIIYTFEDHSCLLSDRGFSTPLPENDHLSFDFNLTSKSFIRYIFTDIDSIVPGRMTEEEIENFKATKEIKSFHIHNDIQSLSIYNKHVVSQCNSKVFCSDPICFGLD